MHFRLSFLTCIWRSAVSWRLLSASRIPLRPEACDVMKALRALGIKQHGYADRRQ